MSQNEVTVNKQDEKMELIPVKEIIFGLAIVLLAGALCYYTWSNPHLLDLVFDSASSGRGSRKLKGLLFLIYNRATGTISGIICLAVSYSLFIGISGRIKHLKNKAA